MRRKAPSPPSAQILALPLEHQIQALGRPGIRFLASDPYEQSRHAHTVVIETLATVRLDLDNVKALEPWYPGGVASIIAIQRDLDHLQSLADRLYKLAVPGGHES